MGNLNYSIELFIFSINEIYKICQSDLEHASLSLLQSNCWCETFMKEVAKRTRFSLRIQSLIKFHLMWNSRISNLHDVDKKNLEKGLNRMSIQMSCPFLWLLCHCFLRFCNASLIKGNLSTMLWGWCVTWNSASPYVLIRVPS